MKIERELSIAKNIEAAWDVLGNQFADMDKWASFVSKSEMSGDPKEVGSIRSMETTNGHTKQKVTSFDASNHSLSYAGIEGVPFFLENVSASWSLSAIDENSTSLVLNFSADTKGIAGLFLGPVVKMKFGKIAGELLDDFKVFVETGAPSPRKVAASR